jgi:DNA primase
MTADLEQIVNYTRYLLKESPEAEEVQSYINCRIGKEAQEIFSFGYFPPSSKINLLLDLVGFDSLKEHQLSYVRQTSNSMQKVFSYFEDHPMVMPYRDVYGGVIALVGRSILSDENRKDKKLSKYKNTIFNKGNHLFGLYEAKDSIIESGFVYLVEGQFDVIKAHERGLKNIVALGNSSMTPYQASLLSRYTDTVFVVLDNDDAGEKGRKKIEDKYGDHLNLVNLFLPDGYKDIDEYLKQNSVDSLTFLC